MIYDCLPLTVAGSDVFVMGDNEPTLGAHVTQPYGVIGVRTKQLVFEDNILAHFLKIIGYAARNRAVYEDHATFLGISHRRASLICLGVTSKS